MEEQKLEQVTPEALAKQKQQKSRNRIFGLIVFLDVALLALIVVEIVQLALK